MTMASDGGGSKPRKFTPEQEATYARVYGPLWRAGQAQGVPPRPARDGRREWATGAQLSLRILSGKLQNTRCWSGDVIPHQVECGTVQLDELAKGRVRDLAEELGGRWPREMEALASGVRSLAREWAKATPDDRRSRLDVLIKAVDDLEARL